MKVLCVPHVNQLSPGESGIHTVIRNWFTYGPEAGIEFVTPGTDSFDVLAVHAGMTNNYPAGGNNVAVLHGLYFNADYNMPTWSNAMNANIIDTIRKARQVTVPSAWVGEVLQRDARITPHVTPHGINWQEWSYSGDHDGYVVAYAKNRDGVDVCDSTLSTELASRCPDVRFVGTFAKRRQGNYKITGVVPYNEMKRLVQRAAVFVSPAKETFGIAALEAMAAGTPVLTANYGSVPDLVQHGVGGYCYEPGNLQDMGEGLRYCLAHRDQLSANARQLAKEYSWQKAMGKVHDVFELAMKPELDDVSIIIPVYNKDINELSRAIQSAVNQTVKPNEIIVVDDGSDNGSEVEHYINELLVGNVRYARKKNAGVAHARNDGVGLATSKFVVCLDADDWLDPRYVETCLPHFKKDNSLGIVYTGLQWHKPDGSTGLSDWPGGWDFDQQLKRKNQVPTCCMFRKSMWERLGGYRQRYAPDGAGAEDAEFWLRSGAYGYRAEKVTDEGLFHYSWMSGETSNPEYREVDWTAWHPWVKDGEHPILSFAKPARHSHPVRQYDEPTVSVIIPVGPNHVKEVVNALDSLEAQTFRKWEAIVVWDNDSSPTDILASYPYIRLVNLRKSHGAGAARNRGADEARGPFLLFLDADDGLYPQFIETCLMSWNSDECITYTDYVGIASVDDPEKLSPQGKKNLLQYNAKKKQAVIKHRAADYDYNLAARQPENPPFIWCNVTALTPKAWHDEIGGFDETMKSWEDVDYWYRLAWAGKCFKRIPEPLMVYRFYSGERRETGLAHAEELIEYIKDKKQGVTLMGCSGCNKSSVKPTINTPLQHVQQRQMEIQSMSDEEFVMIEYMSANRGQHPVYGPERGGKRLSYGYRAGGDRFLAHRDDQRIMKHIFREVETTSGVIAPRVARPAPQAPSPIEASPPPPVIEDQTPVQRRAIDDVRFDVASLPGITLTVSERMTDVGLNSVPAIRKAGVNGLTEIKGIAETRALAILAYLDQHYDND